MKTSTEEQTIDIEWYKKHADLLKKITVAMMQMHPKGLHLLAYKTQWIIHLYLKAQNLFMALGSPRK